MSRGDIRRLFRLVAILDQMQSSGERATLVSLAEKAYINKGQISRMIERINNELDIGIEREAGEFRIVYWGPFICRDGIKRVLDQSDVHKAKPYA